jgi:hypothetical protein
LVRYYVVYMSHHLFSPKRVLLFSLVSLVIIAVALQVLPQQAHETTGQPSGVAATSSVPAFTSATFPAGDSLLGLGPEWTFLRQEELSEKDGAWLAGTVPTRQSVARLITGNVQLFLVESRIQDQAALDKALTDPSVKRVSVAGRDGYLVPVGDAQGSTAFALMGQTTMLLIQDGLIANWPKDPAPEVLAYVASLHLP